MNFSVGELIHSGDLYDLVNQFDYDLPFYKRLIKCFDSSSILELCCGTGRLTIPLAKEGYYMTGIDINESMLAKAKEKARLQDIENCHFVQGDVITFDLNKYFSFIFIPFNSMHHIFNLHDLERFLKCVHQHLLPNGTFVIDILNPNIEFIVSHKDKTSLYKKIKMNNSSIEIKQTMEYDALYQVNRVKWIYNMQENEVVQNLDMRLFFPQEVEAILKYNGFKIISKMGDYDDSEYSSISPKQILVCQKV